MDDHKDVVTRFAPSPTGKLHSGAYRTGIFSYLYARHYNGKFILRIEDTDKERSTKENEENILESLKWLGLEYDELYRQSDHVERHKEVLLKMIEDGHAYISKEEAKDGSGVIKEIIRFKNPNTDVTFYDKIKGEVTMHTADLGDFVIAKNIDEPLFHLAVVVDDWDAKVTHVIRGEDHVSNTPRQILIQKAIGAPVPMYAHLPLVLGEDKQKLSKRKGALAITEYRDLGYLPEAILNMVALVGWNPGTEQELFNKEELVKEFHLSKVQKSPAVFNPEKLNWFNREYIKKLDSEKFWSLAEPFISDDIKNKDTNRVTLKKIETIIRDHISCFSDIKNMLATGELTYFFHTPQVDTSMIIWKDLRGQDDGMQKTKEYISTVYNLLEKVENWDKENIKSAIWEYAEEKGRGAVLWPVRMLLSGKEKSADPFTIAEVIGKEETLKRLKI